MLVTTSQNRISIHTPCGGSDQNKMRVTAILNLFQSTLPVGGATPWSDQIRPVRWISIHTPRGGSDGHRHHPILSIFDFNPHSPWGERRFADGGLGDGADFNPHSPWGERPQQMAQQMQGQFISIHAPRGGSDEKANATVTDTVISIHAPRGGSDPSTPSTSANSGGFQSTLPAGGATVFAGRNVRM